MAKGRRPKAKVGVEPIAPAAWQRIRHLVATGAVSPQHGTELGRLSYLGVLTATEVAAGFRIAEIYGRYERLIGTSRSARSPSYELGFTGGADDRGAPDEHSVEEAEQGRCRCRDCNTRRAWLRVQGKMPNALARAVIEDLCVEDRPVSSLLLADVRVVLAVLAADFGIVNAPKMQKTELRPRRAAEAPVAPAPPAKKASGVEREVFSVAMRLLRPDLKPDQIDSVYHTYVALKDRAAFRRTKKPSANHADRSDLPVPDEIVQRAKCQHEVLCLPGGTGNQVVK